MVLQVVVGDISSRFSWRVHVGCLKYSTRLTDHPAARAGIIATAVGVPALIAIITGIVLCLRKHGKCMSGEIYDDNIQPDRHNAEPTNLGEDNNT